MTRFATQPIPYPAAKDYGSRDRWPTLAVVWHMAEGRNVAQYLARDPLRGVSVHYTVEQATDRWKDGEVVRCLPEDRICGSINPRTIRRGDDPDGYFGASHAKAALGLVLAGDEPELPGHQRRGRRSCRGGPDRGPAALDGRAVGRAEGALPEGHPARPPRLAGRQAVPGTDRRR